MSFSTNAYTHHHAPGSKEYISLTHSATVDFKPKTLYDLLPSNADKLIEDVRENAQIYAFTRHVSKVPTTQTIDPDDATNITFGDEISLLDTWHGIDPETIQKNATEVWGAQDWTVTENKEVVALSVARNEINGRNLTDAGKKLFKERWRSMVLGLQLLKMLSSDAKDNLLVRRSEFEWTDPESG